MLAAILASTEFSAAEDESFRREPLFEPMDQDPAEVVPPPVCAADPKPGERFVKSVLAPTNEQRAAARTQFAFLREQHRSIVGAIQEWGSNAELGEREEIHFEPLSESRMRSDGWPDFYVDCARSADRLFAPTGDARLQRIGLLLETPDDRAALDLAATGGDPQSSSSLIRASLLHHVRRGDWKRAIPLIDQGAFGDIAGAEVLRNEFIAAADSSAGRAHRAKAIGLLRRADPLRAFDLLYLELLWREFDGCAEYPALSAVAGEIVDALAPPIRRGTLPFAVKLYVPYLMLGNDDSQTTTERRIRAIFELGCVFASEVNSNRDDRIAAAFFHAVVSHGTGSPQFPYALFDASILDERLAEPSRVIADLPRIFDTSLDDCDPAGLMQGYANYRHESAMRLSRCYEAIGDGKGAIEWLLRARDEYRMKSGCGTCAGYEARAIDRRLRSLRTGSTK